MMLVPFAEHSWVSTTINVDVSESVGLAEVLLPGEEDGNSQVACMYTGVTNLYRCYKR
jgi:hypothetical protein